MTRRQDGYRYLRQYRTGPGGNNRENYALFETQDGKRRRVGTARTYEAGLAFITYQDNA